MRKELIYPYGTSIKRILLLAVIQWVCFYSKGQSYTGYHSSTYSGVYAILTNPADILNHRYRRDVNLLGFSAGVGNNIIKFSYKKREDDKGGVSFPEPIMKKGKVNLNMDIFGPGLLLRLSDKNAIALTTRARVVTNVHGVSTDILNSLLPDTLRSYLVGNTLSASNMTMQMHAWKEVALTYSRQVANNDKGVWKLGASLKYLGGAAAFSLSTNKLSFIHDSVFDAASGRNKDALINPQGSIAIGYTKNIDSLGSGDYFSFKNPGVGLDIGVSYEYRDEFQVYETIYNDKTNSYLWKVGASITDIGFIKYNKQDVKNIVTKFNGKNYLLDDLDLPSDSGEIYQAANYYTNLFKSNTSPSALTMQLPTTLHLTYDRFFNEWIGVQAQLNIPLLFSRLNYYIGNYHPVSVSVTPRAELSWAGLYVPLSYSSIAGFQMGAALRLGPLVIGSASIINSRILGRTRGADVYFILRVPIFGYRAYKEKEYFETHPRLTKKQRKALDCPGK
jgi:hypothetical protein